MKKSSITKANKIFLTMAGFEIAPWSSIHCLTTEWQHPCGIVLEIIISRKKLTLEDLVKAVALSAAKLTNKRIKYRINDLVDTVNNMDSENFGLKI